MGTTDSSNLEPRTFEQWCIDLGIECEGRYAGNEVMSYDEFCCFPNVRLWKVQETELYGFWRDGKDVSQSDENRTVKEWLEDMNMEIVDPTQKELNELNLFLGWDEFMDWSSGIVADKNKKATFDIFKTLRRLFKNNSG
jgi:hypothetical protein